MEAKGFEEWWERAFRWVQSGARTSLGTKPCRLEQLIQSDFTKAYFLVSDSQRQFLSWKIKFPPPSAQSRNLLGPKVLHLGTIPCKPAAFQPQLPKAPHLPPSNWSPLPPPQEMLLRLQLQALHKPDRLPVEAQAKAAKIPPPQAPRFPPPSPTCPAKSCCSKAPPH